MSGQVTYKAEADFLFPEGCKCGNNGGGDCDWCGVYYDGECPDCGHNVSRHRDRYGCQKERTIGNLDGYKMDVPCGCERLAMFYRPVSTKWECERKGER